MAEAVTPERSGQAGRTIRECNRNIPDKQVAYDTSPVPLTMTPERGWPNEKTIQEINKDISDNDRACDVKTPVQSTVTPYRKSRKTIKETNRKISGNQLAHDVMTPVKSTVTPDRKIEKTIQEINREMSGNQSACDVKTPVHSTVTPDRKSGKTIQETFKEISGNLLDVMTPVHSTVTPERKSEKTIQETDREISGNHLAYDGKTPVYPTVTPERKSGKTIQETNRDISDNQLACDMKSPVHLPVNPENSWQVGKTIKECNSEMLDNPLACDVKFSVESLDGAVETISAHKYVLVSRSPVFEEMLFRDYAEAICYVVVPDIEPQIFREMLRFMYTAEANITLENVFHLLSAAKKYILQGLEQSCMNFLEKNIKKENVCAILDQAADWGVDKIATKCLKMMVEATEEVLQSESFLEMSQPSLIKMLKHDSLFLKGEDTILDACKKWAERKLRKAEDDTNETLQTTLGDAVFQIRFGSIATCDIVDSEIVSDKMFRLLSICTKEGTRRSHAEKELKDAGYNIRPRICLNAVKSATRFPSMATSYVNQKRATDSMGFIVNKPIHICGVSVFCSPKRVSHTCEMQVYTARTDTKGVWTHETSTTLVSDGILVQQDVMLEKPLKLKPYVAHAVQVVLTGDGDGCYYGIDDVDATVKKYLLRSLAIL